MSQSPKSLSYYIAERSRLVPKTEKLSVTNQNWAQKTLILRQPIRFEKKKNHQIRQPIRIEYYITRDLSARVEIPSQLSTRVGSL